MRVWGVLRFNAKTQSAPRKRKERHYEQDFPVLLNLVTDFESTKLFLTGRLGRMILEHDRNLDLLCRLRDLCGFALKSFSVSPSYRNPRLHPFAFRSLRLPRVDEQPGSPGVSRPSRQEIQLQVLDTDRHHCQNRESIWDENLCHYSVQSVFLST